MSHPSSSDKNHTKVEASPQTDRELAAALRSMALATQDPLPIFNLNVDCWEEIFDWLSVTDLHLFGQTCKFFHRIAGKYFEWKYRRVLIRIYGDKFEAKWKESNVFNEFAQRLSFHDPEPDKALLHASANCKSPNELKIVKVRASNLDINRLENMLTSVEVLTFAFLSISDEFMEAILKLCATNLRRLTIDKSERCDWMQIKYPKLQYLKLNKCISSRELVRFLEANPSVRSFSTLLENILEYQTELMASYVELDDLTVTGGTDLGDFVPNTLNDLYERGFFKRLHFTAHPREHLGSLPGLTTLNFGTEMYIDIPHLPNVTRLSFRPIWNGMYYLCDWLKSDAVLNALVNLESVLIHTSTCMENLMPFIRISKKLKEIKLEYYRLDTSGDIDPVLMNSEREKLNGAHKVTIYVQEKDYLRIKWRYGRSNFGLIELKRHECYDGLLDHCFDS